MSTRKIFLTLALVCAAHTHTQSAEKSHFGMKPVSIAGAMEKIVIDDMPRTRDQGGFGICYAMTAATLIDHATCTTIKSTLTRDCVREQGLSQETCAAKIEAENKNYCENLAPEYTASAFHVARYTNKPLKDSRGVADYSDPFALVGISEEGDLPYTLNNAIKISFISSNACAPFEQVLPKIQDLEQRTAANVKFWQDLRALYNWQRSGALDNAGLLAEFNKLREGLEIKATDDEVLLAFGDLDEYGKKRPDNLMSFEAVVEYLFIQPECHFEGLIEVDLRYVGKVFPPQEMPMNKDSYTTAISHIKSIMKEKKVPLGIGFCADPANQTKIKSIEGCNAQKDKQGQLISSGFAHAVAVKGYARVCNQSGKKCYDALQVQNSWSEQWQQENNDGWVDARILLDRTFYGKNSITWLEAK